MALVILLATVGWLAYQHREQPDEPLAPAHPVTPRVPPAGIDIATARAEAGNEHPAQPHEFNAEGAPLAVAFGLPGFKKDRLYHVLELCPVEGTSREPEARTTEHRYAADRRPVWTRRPDGSEVTYDFDDESSNPLCRGNLMRISWSTTVPAQRSYVLGQTFSNHFHEGEDVPDNPPVPFASNAPYFVAEEYSRDRGGHTWLVFLRRPAGSYDWTIAPPREHQVGAVETEGLAVRFYDRCPGGRLLGSLRIDRSSAWVDIQGLVPPHDTPLLRSWQGEETRIAPLVEFFSEEIH